ncbi:nucleotidyltransferase domain-containing protein [Thermodesulfobacteriota bacterium]
MIKYKKLPDNIEQLLPRAADYLHARPDVVFAYLFGGLVQGARRMLSDVDIAVYLATGAGPAEKKLDILGGLMDALCTDEIDLVLLNSAPEAFKMKILEHKKILVDKVPPVRHRYESLTFRRYFDFAPYERKIIEKRLLHG